MKFLTAILCLVACFCQAEDFALAEVSVHFSPHGGCEAELVDCIAHARAQIRSQYYSFTSKPVIAALLDAHRRGVDVAVILDRKWNSTAPTGKDALIAGGIRVILDGHHPIMHSKVTIVDAAIVLNGSYNPTAQAEKYNAENLVTTRNAEFAAHFLADWNKHAAEP